MLQLLPHSGKIVNGVFCVSVKEKNERQRRRAGKRQTARGTPQVLAQLALMDKSITPSFHATPDYPCVRCSERKTYYHRCKKRTEWREHGAARKIRTHVDTKNR